MTVSAHASRGAAPLYWWLITRGLLIAAAIAALLVGLYYYLPLDRRSEGSLVLEVTGGLVLLATMIAWQVRAIVRSDYPAIRAIQALTATTALFLLVFASIYYTVSLDDTGTFSEELSRTDALYFTVTIFSTVGFGDIAPRGEAARLVVTTQMLLDLVVLGLGIKAILGAVRRGRATSGQHRDGS
jgi:voltage-gated potassium channel